MSFLFPMQSLQINILDVVLETFTCFLFGLDLESLYPACTSLAAASIPWSNLMILANVW